MKQIYHRFEGVPWIRPEQRSEALADSSCRADPRRNRHAVICPREPYQRFFRESGC